MIILTIPHSNCGNTYPEQHLCDFLAPVFGKILYEKLLVKYNTHIIYSGQNRRILDDNRFYTGENTIKINSTLWTELRNIYKNDSVIFDVHSFPPSSFDSSDIAILDIKPYQKIVKQFVTYMIKKTKLNINIYTAQIGSNSIIDIFTLHPQYTPTILIEVNEKYLNNYGILHWIAENITNFINEYLQYRNNKNKYIIAKKFICDLKPPNL